MACCGRPVRPSRRRTGRDPPESFRRRSLLTLRLCWFGLLGPGGGPVAFPLLFLFPLALTIQFLLPLLAVVMLGQATLPCGGDADVGPVIGRGSGAALS